MVQIRLERAEVCRQGPEKLEPPAGSTDSPPGFEQVLDSLALADSSGEEKRAFRPVALVGERAKSPAVGSIGDHADLAGRRTVSHQSFGDMVRRHEHAIGQRKVAKPALVQPCQQLSVEGAVSQVNPHEIRRRLRFPFRAPPALRARRRAPCSRSS